MAECPLRRGRGARHFIHLPIPKDIRFISFDCYGTLIDWETGAYDAFQAEADKDGFTIDRDQLIPVFVQTQREIMRGSYELYAEVMRRTAVKCAQELGWDLEPSRAQFLPDSIPRWPAFRETNAQLDRFAKKFEIGLISNIDDKLLGATRRHFRADWDLVVTAQQVRSYKPDPAHFKECGRRIGGKKGWVHIGSGYETDIEPALKEKIPVIWVNRHGEKLESNQKKPTEEVKNLREAAKLLGAA
jgi:2-haloacid dehalogenase